MKQRDLLRPLIKGIKRHVQSQLKDRAATLFTLVNDRHASAWIHSNKVVGPLSMSSPVARTAFSRQFGLPVYNQAGDCPLCGQEADIYGDHAMVCKVGGANARRHYGMTRALAAFCTEAEIPHHFEIGLLLKASKRRRQGDIMFPNGFEFDGFAPLLVDFGSGTPFRKNQSAAVTEEKGLTALQIEERKHKKYDSDFEDKPQRFMVLAVESFGRWGMEGLPLIQQIIRAVALKRQEPYSVTSADFWQTMAIRLQTLNATAVLERDPSLPPTPFALARRAAQQ